MSREVTFSLECRGERHKSSRWVQGNISFDAVVWRGSLFWVPLIQSHTFAGTGGQRESHWQSKPPSIRHKHVCTRTHTDVYIQRDSPLRHLQIPSRTPAYQCAWQAESHVWVEMHGDSQSHNHMP